jgi:hypothetical protein
LRTTGGFIRSIFKGDWKECTKRIATLTGRQADPYDTYQWLDELHEKHQLKPKYFFLLAEKTSRYDKNVLLKNKALQQLVKRHGERYPVGIHPSWRSGDETSLLKSEINTLEQLTRIKVVSSRQHYIRFTLPETFRRLISHGINLTFLWDMEVSMAQGFSCYPFLLVRFGKGRKIVAIVISVLLYGG